LHFAGKGNNVTLEFFIPLEHTTDATESVGEHVPENRGARESLLTDEQNLISASDFILN
jgi:hypothetical protein